MTQTRMFTNSMSPIPTHQSKNEPDPATTVTATLNVTIWGADPFNLDCSFQFNGEAPVDEFDIGTSPRTRVDLDLRGRTPNQYDSVRVIMAIRDDWAYFDGSKDPSTKVLLCVTAGDSSYSTSILRDLTEVQRNANNRLTAVQFYVIRKNVAPHQSLDYGLFNLKIWMMDEEDPDTYSAPCVIDPGIKNDG